MRFTEKVAVVTGAASGIGLATAERLGSEGARVVIVDLDQARAEAAESAVMTSGAPEAMTCACDVANEQQVESVIQKTMERFARLDVIVNNAGLMTFKPIEELSEGDWLKILRVDLLGAFFFIKQAFLKMTIGGSIVNVASVHAEQTSPLVAPYAAAKAALVSLTRSAAIEGKQKGIRVNAVLPGAIDTPMLWNNPNIKSGQETVDRAYIGKAESVAAAIAYLASEDSLFIDGTAGRVDGGRLARL